MASRTLNRGFGSPQGFTGLRDAEIGATIKKLAGKISMLMMLLVLTFL